MNSRRTFLRSLLALPAAGVAASLPSADGSQPVPRGEVEWRTEGTYYIEHRLSIDGREIANNVREHLTASACKRRFSDALFP